MPEHGTTAATEIRSPARPEAQDRAAIPASAPAAKLDVFVSYSRDDIDFADQLVAALALYGFSPTIDRHGISGGEAWQQRLGGLILEADTIVFVLSPSSARSEICTWEVAEAFRLGKRILPVVPRPLGDAVAPRQLADLNYVFFYPEARAPGSGFGTGLARLVEALSTDLSWIRQHTRLLERAVEWDLGGRSANRLLSGSDIVAAKAWVASRPKGAPEPTTQHLDYIRASEAEETSRASAERRRLDEMAAVQAERAVALATAEQALKDKAEEQKAKLWLRNAIVAVAMVAAIGLGTLSYFLYDAFRTAESEQKRAWRAQGEANLARQAAQSAFTSAEDARKQAEADRSAARESLYEAEVNRARALIAKAEDLVEVGHIESATLLAIEAVSVDTTRHEGREFYIPGANRILALSDLVWRSARHEPKTQITALAVSPDEQLIASGGSDKHVRVVRLADGKAGGSIQLEATVAAIAFTPDGTHLVAAADKFVHLIDVKARPIARKLRVDGHSKPVVAVAVSPDGRRIASGSEDGKILFWDAATMTEIGRIEAAPSGAVRVERFIGGSDTIAVRDVGTVHVLDVSVAAGTSKPRIGPLQVHAVAFSPDGTRAAIFDGKGELTVLDPLTGSPVRTVKVREGVENLSLANDGSILGATFSDGRNHKNPARVLRWPAGTDQPFEVATHFGPVDQLAMVSDGRALTAHTIGDTPTLWLWPAEPRPGPGFLLEHAKRKVKRCLRVGERLEFILGPVQKPPHDWCLRMQKPPYKNGTLIGSIAAIRDYSDGALYNGDFVHALEAADLALQFEPQADWVEVNKAHALMFLNRWNEAREIYLRRRGEKLTIGTRHLNWDAAVLEDFDVLERNGLTNGLMDQVRSLLKPSENDGAGRDGAGTVLTVGGAPATRP